MYANLANDDTSHRRPIAVARLKSLIPPDSLTFDEFCELAEDAEVEHVPAGRVIFSWGDADRNVVYLVSGEVALCAFDGSEQIFDETSPVARQPIVESQPGALKAIARSDASIVRFDRNRIKALHDMRTAAPAGGVEVHDAPPGQSEGGDGDWMTRLLELDILEHLPPANIHSLYTRVRELPVQAGRVVLRQGDLSDAYYIVMRGRCRMTRRTSAGATVPLGELGAGNAFGGEEILTEAPSSITVTMETDGLLLALSREDFEQLVEKPLLRPLTIAQAQRMRAPEPVYLDVRTPGERVAKPLEGSTSVPLFMLRVKAEGFDRERPYVCCCDTGHLSSAAAFLLRGMGFDAYVLEGGLSPTQHTGAVDGAAPAAKPAARRTAPMTGAPRTGLRARGARKDAVGAGTQTLGDVLDAWIQSAAENGGKKVSRQDERICRKYLIPALGEIEFDALDQERVDAYCSKALADGRLDGNGGLAASTVKRHTLVLRRALASAAAHGLIPCDPLGPGTAKAHATPAAATPGEDLRHAVLAAAVGTRFHLASLLASTTGLMLGEILALRWKDLRDDRLHVTRYMVQTPTGLEYRSDAEGYQGRTFVLPAAVVDELARQRDGAARARAGDGTGGNPGEELMIRRTDGSPWAPDAMVSSFQDLVRKVGAETCRFEELYEDGAPGLAVEVESDPAREAPAKKLASAARDERGSELESEEVARMLEDALSRGGKRF